MSRGLLQAFRRLRKNFVFTAAAVVTISLGVGASTTIFSVMNGVLLRPLPYNNPERLVIAGRDMLSNADFFDLRRATASVFDDMAGVSTFRAFVSREDGSTEQISRALVTTNFLRMMGATIILGRDFIPTDLQPGAGSPEAVLPPGSAAILSYEYWQRRYGGDAGVLGREVLSSGQRGSRIVGVLAPGFRLFFPPIANIASTPDFWVANNFGYDNAHRNLLTLQPVARLRAGVGLSSAQERVNAITAGLRERSPGWNFGRHIRLEPMHRYLVEEARPAILALMGSVMFLLLIACANVANLLLVRLSMREREFAVRAALGGSRRRLMCAVLMEAALLSGLGTLLGMGLSWLGLRELLSIAPGNLPRLEAVGIDWRVLLFAAAAGLVAIAIFGAIPAWRAARPNVMQALRGSGPAARPFAARRLGDLAIIAEVVLAFVLLSGAGLMLRSFLELRRIDPGYDPRGLLTFMIAREWPIERQAGRQALLREIQTGLAALPGVENVTASVSFPLAPGVRPVSSPTEPQRPAQPTAAGADFQFVLPGYFETLRTPLLAGRTFTEDDNVPGRRVAVIDQRLAAKAFPNGSAVGKRILVPWPDIPWVEVIGVVAHQRARTLADPGREAIYFADGFDGIGVSRHWAIRTTGDPIKYAAAVRSEIARIDRRLVISQMEPMTALVDRDRAGTRFDLILIAVFATIAVPLAAVGLYGVLSTIVEQRTAEIGVRIALGSDRAGIFLLVVGHGLRLSATAIGIGILAAVALTRVIASLLVGVKPNDPGTFGAAATFFLLVAGTACWLPARRAALVDPNIALRHE